MAEKLLEKLDMSWSEDSVRYINTPSKKAKKLYFYVQEVGEFRAHFPYFTERAKLDSFLIILTLQGEGLLYCHEKKFLCKPDTLAFINCSEHHRYECIPETDWEFLWLHFNGPSALGYYKEFASDSFRLIHRSENDVFEKNLRAILKLSQEKILHYEPRISVLITELLISLIIKNTEKSLGMQGFPGYINQSLNYIEKHYFENLNLDSLANICHISKFHFAKQFKRYMKVSPNEYLIMVRLNHAKELLKYTEYTIDEISEACGFNQSSHFIRTFKNRVGLTPLKYRKKWNQ